MHTTDTARCEPSVFQKFGGIRPMAAKLGLPPSTIKSWHTKQSIPDWRRKPVMEAALDHEIDLSMDEIVNIRPDADRDQQAAA